ncbi:ABC transporter ATP-binding protein [Pseudooceanicola nanhaiensis]|uniref:ABC transporter ATP-binding protein n=1 Tax=Pseudooceanicola nanhaiensis TaxID=375761 RepID=UPI001CD1D9EB|nr:ABC transporter ATP-binding protein [Pseudooceanicola nanhaiensis]MCA0918786.1 ABC transporter ATP-binding protein [Pseudooceanicola nanhaiensis]
MTSLLTVKSLCVGFPGKRGVLPAVEDLDFHIAPGETLAIVGESGSGKSTAALSIPGLLSRSSRPVVSGSVRFEGQEMLNMPDRKLARMRGPDVGMIFQDPSTSLNPVFTIGRQICEPLRTHMGLDARAAEARAIELLELVKVSAPEQRLAQYPHNLSGGMRQRVMIAIALACSPRLLIADEPTTALDVTVQAQVLRLISGLQKSLGMAVLLITHDLGVVWETADRVIVMYAGRKVEEGPVRRILSQPSHPYTEGLLRAARKEGRDGFLTEIPGVVPPPHQRPPGCAFEPRCARAIAACRAAVPAIRSTGPGQVAACIRAEEGQPA